MHLYLSGVWLDMALRMDTKKNLFERDWTMCSKSITIMGSIVDIIEGGRGAYMTVY